MTYKPNEVDDATREVIERVANGQANLQRIAASASGNARVRVGRNIWAAILDYFDQSDRRSSFVLQRTTTARPTKMKYKGDTVFDDVDELRILGMPVEYDNRLEHDEILISLEVRA